MITKNDALNLIDALTEWYDIVQPKELEKNEIGLNSDRYESLISKLHLITNKSLKTKLMKG